jgi:hypothetical protein
MAPRQLHVYSIIQHTLQSSGYNRCAGAGTTSFGFSNASFKHPKPYLFPGYDFHKAHVSTFWKSWVALNKRTYLQDRGTIHCRDRNHGMGVTHIQCRYRKCI